MLYLTIDMSEKFTNEFFAGNRARLRELFAGTAPIVLTANGLLQRGGDNTWPFRQDASFWYVTGLDEPDLVLVMDKDKEYVIVPGRSDVREAFDGRLLPEELAARSGIQTIMNEKDGWKQLGARLKRANHVATLGALPEFVDTHGFYANPSRRRLTRKLKSINSKLELLDLRPAFGRLRMVKQPLELEAIQASIDLTIEALKVAHKRLPKLEYEYELDAVITNYFLSHGAGNAWEPLVAGGVNACTIHPRDKKDKLNSGELVTLDVGAELNHYDADVTRTWSIGGQPSKRQQAAHAAVLAAQEHAFSLIKPGMQLREYEQQMEQFVGEKLRELGLIKIIEKAAVRKYFPHATSHFLGLDPHDAGDYERALEPGVVLAVEPGIYIPEENFGVRIEDDVVLTPDGNQVLSARLPRTLN